MESFVIGLVVFCILFAPLIFGVFAIFFKSNTKKQKPSLSNHYAPVPSNEKTVPNNKSENHTITQLTITGEISSYITEEHQKSKVDFHKILKSIEENRNKNILLNQTESGSSINPAPTDSAKKESFNLYNSPASPSLDMIKGTCEGYAKVSVEASAAVKQLLVAPALQIIDNHNKYEPFYYLNVLSKSEIPQELEKARNQIKSAHAYDALKLLIPHHFETYFGSDYERLNNWQSQPYEIMKYKFDALHLIESNRDSNRSYIAKVIATCPIHWKDVLFAVEIMEHRSMIPRHERSDLISNELEKIRWCAKYWFRALAFDEKLRFIKDSQYISLGEGRRVFVEVADKNVPERLRLSGKYNSEKYFPARPI